MNSIRRLLLLLSGVFVFLPCIATADEYHYKDVLIGERAAGLGGAFTAISDDPSGIFYNPAGIVFGSENYLSVSANAYTTGSQRFKDVFPGKDYTYRNQNFFPALFGFTQGSGKGKFGFAIMAPVSDLVDQDDSITNETSAGNVRTLTRRFFRQDSTYLFGPAYARELAPNFSIGFSLLGFYRVEKLIDNQLIQIDPTGTNKYVIQNSAVERNALGVIPKIGLQWMPAPRWSLGLCLTKTVNASSYGKYKIVSTKTAGNDPVTPTGNFDNDMSLTGSSNVASKVAEPYVASLGVAYFTSKDFLVTAQLDAYTAEPFADYELRAVYNWSVGSEYYLNEGLAMRLGLFSNNARNRPLEAGKVNQLPHVDLLGSTLSFTFFRANSSVTLGAAYSWGTGSGQAIYNNSAVHSVVQSSVTFYLSGSYQL